MFREFLKCEYSEENILFWMACEELKNETDAAVIEAKCRSIYDDYISILSPKEVSVQTRRGRVRPHGSHASGGRSAWTHRFAS